MAGNKETDEQIREVFNEKFKEYQAFDRTLDALASLRAICKVVKEIAAETVTCDFRARLKPVAGAEPYTPDAVIRQLREHSFVIELKTSWDHSNVEQIVKYAKSPGTLQSDGTLLSFPKNHCILVGYQNTPDDKHLDQLFNRLKEENIAIPIVVFRYALEVGTPGNRMFFSRVPHARNGFCLSSSSLGKAFNSARGILISDDVFKFERAAFHRASDSAPPTYAGILWWIVYVRYYLNDDQKAEMAEKGRLSSPLMISVDSLDNVPIPDGVEVTLTPKDVRNGLEFLRQAGLAVLKKQRRIYEIDLKTRILPPKVTSLPTDIIEQDITAKLIARWATRKVKSPISDRLGKKKVLRGRRSRRDYKSGYLFPID